MEAFELGQTIGEIIRFVGLPLLGFYLGIKFYNTYQKEKLKQKNNKLDKK